MTARPLNHLVYMSARNVIPEFADMGRRLGELIASEGHSFTWGGGDAGLMGIPSRAAFLGGANTFGVSHGPLSRGKEGGTRFATIYSEQDNFPERIRMMQSSGDAIIILPGGFGSYQEFERGLKALEDGTIPRIPLILVSPDIGGGKAYYDHMLEQVRERVRRGLLKAWVLDYIIAVPNEAEAFRVAKEAYSGLSDAEWNKIKAWQLQHVTERHAVLAGSNQSLRHYKLPQKLVAVIGSSIGQSKINPRNKQAIDAIGNLMDTIQSAGYRVMAINSNRGINDVIISQAALRNILAMTVTTRAQMEDGRCDVDYQFGPHIPHAVFDNAAQLSGFLTRKCGKIFAMPGADDIVMDVISEFAIRTPGLANTDLVVYNADGSYQQMVNQVRVMERPEFAVGADGKMIGLASTGILGGHDIGLVRENAMAQVAGNDEAFNYLVLHSFCIDTQNYPAVKPPAAAQAEGHGLSISNSPLGLEVARVLLHNAEPRSNRVVSLVQEAKRIAAARRMEMLHSR